MLVVDKALRRLITRGQLTVRNHDGREYRYGAPDPALAPVTVRLTDRRAAFDIARDPRLGAGEAYMDGRLLVEQGDVRDFILLIRANAPWGRSEGLKRKGPLHKAFKLARGKLDQVNLRSRAKRNAEHSYNLSPRLFELFLDEDMQYTCAYYRDTSNSLEAAQQDKKAHIAAKLNLQPGMRVLDIGCGWGGFALYMARHFDCEVTGVALASEQIEVCRRRAVEAGLADRVKFDVMDYRDLGGTFDRITNVGLLEHVAPPHYPEFFRKCRELLAPEGVMLSHFIGRMGKAGVTDRFTAKYIFPGGYIPALSEVISVSEQHRLAVSDVETLRYHYAHTLEEWYRRTNAARAEIVSLYDERFFRMWQFYLAGAEAAFRYGGMVNYQVQFMKSRDSLPMIRDYMFDNEQELLRRPLHDVNQRPRTA